MNNNLKSSASDFLSGCEISSEINQNPHQDTIVPEFYNPSTTSFLEMTNRPGMLAVIDAEDYALCAQFPWHMQGTRGHEYPSRCARKAGGEKPGRRIRLHHYVLNIEPKKGQVIDHINGNKLDNRKSNLRVCTQADNQHNRRKTSKKCTTRFKGVYLSNRKNNPWTAQIGIKGRTQYIGSFETQEEAARAYDRRAILAFGVYAHLNFPIKRLKS